MYAASKYAFVKQKKSAGVIPKEQIDRADSESDEDINDDDMEIGLERAHKMDQKKPASTTSTFSNISSFFTGKKEEKVAPSIQPTPAVKPGFRNLKQKVKKEDTNIMSVKLVSLIEKQAISTGDPVFCKCKAVLSAASSIAKGDISTTSPT